MTAHNHREYMPGCFRCDLSREETTTERSAIDELREPSPRRPQATQPLPDGNHTMNTNLTPKGAKPNPPHNWAVTATTPHTETVTCRDCGKTKHRKKGERRG